MTDKMGSDKRHNHSKIKGVTKGKAINVTYEWKIHNFSIIGKRPKEPLCSAIFSAPNSVELRWQLILYPKGWVTSLNSYMSAYLKFHPCRKYREIEASFKIYILSEKKEKLCCGSQTSFFTYDNCRSGFDEFANRSSLTELYNPNNCLTFVCEITYCIDVVNLPNEVDEIPSFIDSHFGKLQSGYKALFKSQELSDVILSSSGKELHAHKAILAAQSPVFLAMFGSDMKEKSNNRVDIVDVDFGILQEMLRYIYTGEVENMPAIVNDLLAASDKYNVEALKNECEQYFCKELNVDNVMDVYRIADRFNARILKTYTLKFMRIHEEELLEREVMDLREKLDPIVLARCSREDQANYLNISRLTYVGKLSIFVASGIVLAFFIKTMLRSEPERIVIQSPVLPFDQNGLSALYIKLKNYICILFNFC